MRRLNGRDVHPWFGAGGEGILQALLVGVGLAKDLTGIQSADGWPLGRDRVPRGRNALWSMGPWGARNLHGHGIAKGERILPCEWCRRRYACYEPETAPHTKVCGGPVDRFIWPEGMQRGTRSGFPLPRCVVLPHTSCGYHWKSTLMRNLVSN